MDILQKICTTKKEHVEHQKTLRTLNDLKFILNDKALPSSFVNALKRAPNAALIAEVKKASPSKGVIRKNFDPISIAKIYQKCGAACISVLTDEPYFQGSDDYLVQIKNEIEIPVLRKDFMIDPYQIYESRALGADCILLIMAALDNNLARELYMTARSLGMDVLVEVHDLEELERALTLDPMMIGVNNRNLKTLDVDVKTSFELMMHMPKDCLKISESGIASHETLIKLHNAGYKAFLVGESLMRQDDIADAICKLMNTTS